MSASSLSVSYHRFLFYDAFFFFFFFFQCTRIRPVFGQVPVLVIFVLKCSLLKNFHLLLQF